MRNKKNKDDQKDDKNIGDSSESPNRTTSCIVEELPHNPSTAILSMNESQRSHILESLSVLQSSIPNLVLEVLATYSPPLTSQGISRSIFFYNAAVATDSSENILKHTNLNKIISSTGSSIHPPLPRVSDPGRWCAELDSLPQAIWDPASPIESRLPEPSSKSDSEGQWTLNDSFICSFDLTCGSELISYLRECEARNALEAREAANAVAVSNNEQESIESSTHHRESAFRIRFRLICWRLLSALANRMSYTPHAPLQCHSLREAACSASFSMLVRQRDDDLQRRETEKERKADDEVEGIEKEGKRRKEKDEWRAVFRHPPCAITWEVLELLVATAPPIATTAGQILFPRHDPRLAASLDEAPISVYEGPDAFIRSVAARRMCWLTLGLPHPLLGSLLFRAGIFPTLIASADDGAASVHVSGLRALRHMASEVPAAELIWQRNLLMDVVRRRIETGAGESWPEVVAFAVAMVEFLEGVKDPRAEGWHMLLSQLASSAEISGHNVPRRAPILCGLHAAAVVIRMDPTLPRFDVSDLDAPVAGGSCGVDLAESPGHADLMWTAILPAYALCLMSDSKSGEEKRLLEELASRIVGCCGGEIPEEMYDYLVSRQRGGIDMVGGQKCLKSSTEALKEARRSENIDKNGNYALDSNDWRSSSASGIEKETNVLASSGLGMRGSFLHKTIVTAAPPLLDDKEKTRMEKRISKLRKAHLRLVKVVRSRGIVRI
eukprot:CAMPEP_0175084766 /NCGR_PEP_ID=MMETSP0052_2-20121109/28258_1 /TAXON_ID=51329 ORGANISM="Polytomella parva, Strain SAG 63-3" /NCGR_SAMPLE_ID=MMETSP0052_2 /ASSEMBLY_ACC=CAM_ASM_000194 /LENGTH=724 /DNA_ID=CAMNT_0016356639 /DNA_START=556 /DNA_END=2728 /DNA_ORIENTATION=-